MEIRKFKLAKLIFEKLAREKNVEIVDLASRSRQGLSNAYLVTKIGFDTAENGPVKVRERKNGAQVTKQFVRVTNRIDANIDLL